MPVVREFTLPDLGEGLTGAEVVRWLVEVGEVIAVDQPVVEVETAKAVVEVPCPYGGVVTARYGAEGEEVPVGAPLVTVAVSPEAGAVAETVERPLVGYGVAERQPGARRARVGAKATAASPVAVIETPVVETPVVLPVISPLVRRLAREHGLDLAKVTGSGPDGLIMRRDVEQALVPVSVDENLVPLRGLRKVVAEKLTRSHREIPAATCWVDADATALMELRAQLNRSAGPKVSVLALLARISTAALARFPELNSSVSEDGSAIVRHSAVHLGFAAQSERGLVVPVIRDAHLLGTEQLGAELARLTESARSGRLTPAELTGGTFTLNNYGVFGVDGSTPILNHPEAAMLGVGRITPKPWVYEGELAVRQVTQLSFTFDHRVCDGGTAGGFLRFVADCVEQPGVLLRQL
ncbi:MULTISPECIES: dihydrolipoamide acetyltransferase family protein [unclassified Kitasatospora]|uniref:dihydrolipoamide acetyltransferase family protein n=1 Tax=unclassified Kitasatospora TaxID=2633591 RepID=UPI00070D9372|nr:MULTISPECIES: dihydrolipoamide acetyltransferase family protein [unclassified Kitasatospora]KQV22279.1 branched-chain alpha-keto acid dehydrogenase subunit E2 [Kitasatospora sp. Root107]KRB64675.1 branched-chain alpha-keto acid dehydrogenase subunit E2 [Kitasatospora sp. Root187]